MSQTLKINGTVVSDLVLLTGDRAWHFVESFIKDSQIDHASFALAKEIPELTNVLNDFYAELPEG